MDYKRAMDQESKDKQVETEGEVLPQSCNNQAHSSSSSTAPQPMEGLREVGPPSFLIKLYDMVEDPSTDSVISWNTARNSFIVWDTNQLPTFLPKFFNHNKFSSFVRQLHYYGFRKVGHDGCEFAHEGFLGGQKHLLITILKRRKSGVSREMQPNGGGPYVEMENHGIKEELERLKRDKEMMMAEVEKLRQQQQESMNLMIEMENRIQDMDSEQQYLMDFFSKSLRNPAFIPQYFEILEDKMDPQNIEIRKKRRLTLSAGGDDHSQDDQLASYYASQQQDTIVDAMESSLSIAVDKSIDNISSAKVPTDDEYPDKSIDNISSTKVLPTDDDYPDLSNDYTWEGLLDKDLRIVNEEGVVVGYQSGVEVDADWDINMPELRPY